MDDARSALVPLAKDVRLNGIQVRWGLSHVAGRRVKIPVEELGGSLTLGREGPSGLLHHQKSARSGFGEG